jgi:hypothetical protein
MIKTAQYSNRKQTKRRQLPHSAAGQHIGKHEAISIHNLSGLARLRAQFTSFLQFGKQT